MATKGKSHQKLPAGRASQTDSSTRTLIKDAFANTMSAGEPKRDADVPVLVSKCVQAIEDRGQSIKGLYRVSGVKSHVEKLSQSFEACAELVELDDVHPNVIANVLKQYLRQLPEPLLTYRLYPEFIRIAKKYPGSANGGSSSKEPSPGLEGAPPAAAADLTSDQQQQVIAQLIAVVDKLPRAHYLTLAYLINHLKRVADNHHENNMPSSNLGIVFGPTLLRTSDGNSSLGDTIHQTRVIELLITFADDVFNPVTGSRLDHKGRPELPASIAHVAESPRRKQRSASQALIRAGKAIDFKRLTGWDDHHVSPSLKIPSSNVQRAYSSSAIVTLAGQKVYISNVSGSQTMAPSQSKPSPLAATNKNVPNIAKPTTEKNKPEPKELEELRKEVPLTKRPSISELRRAFFNDFASPPQRAEPITSDLNLSLLNSTPASVTPPLSSPPHLTRLVAPIDTPESSDISAEPSPTGFGLQRSQTSVAPRSLRGTGGGLSSVSSFGRISAYGPPQERKLGSSSQCSSTSSR